MVVKQLNLLGIVRFKSLIEFHYCNYRRKVFLLERDILFIKNNIGTVDVDRAIS